MTDMNMMTELVRQSSWREYYLERDADKRRRLLLAAMESGEDRVENEIRARLMQLRYGKHWETEKQLADRFLRIWMDLSYASKNQNTFFSTKTIERTLKKDLKVMGQEELRRDFGAQGEQLLYEEMHNMAALYIHLCATDRNYSSAIMGLFRLSDDKLDNKIEEEVYRVSHDLPGKMNLREEYRLFSMACQDAYCEMHPDRAAAFRERIEAAADIPL